MWNNFKEEKMIKDILKNSKNIAIVYMSPKMEKTSNYAGAFLQAKGYKIFPVYPKEDFILGHKVYRDIKEIPEAIDIVLMFRKSEFASELVKDVVEIKAKTFWLQMGLENEEAKEICEQNHINFVQNKCIMVEFERHFI